MTEPIDPLDSTACYATAVDASRTVQRARGELPHPRTKRPAPETAGLASFMAGRLRALTRPRVLGIALAWSLVWLLYWHLGSSQSGNRLLSADFPAPPQRAGDELDSRDPRYRALVALPPPPPPFPQLRPTRFLPTHCMESWFIHGTTNCGKHDLGSEEKLDATWTWVNGSDGRWRGEMEYWRREAGIYSPEQHFRSVLA